MLKKSITYEDFDGNTVTEDHYFHLTKADLIEMEVSQKGGMHDYLQKIVESEDGKAIIQTMKELILSSYGTRSEDGKRFIKTPELRDEFQSSEAYSTLFMELCTDTDAAAEFVNGIVPPNMDKEIEKLKAAENGESSSTTRNVFENNEEPRLLTEKEIKEMDVEDLKSGLASGRYRTR